MPVARAREYPLEGLSDNDAYCEPRSHYDSMNVPVMTPRLDPSDSEMDDTGAVAPRRNALALSSSPDLGDLYNEQIRLRTVVDVPRPRIGDSSDEDDTDPDYPPYGTLLLSSSPDLGDILSHDERVRVHTVDDVPLAEISARGFDYPACVRYVFAGLGACADPILVSIFSYVPSLSDRGSDRLCVFS